MKIEDIFNNLNVHNAFNNTDFIFICVEEYDRVHLALLDDNWACTKNTNTYTYYKKDTHILKCVNASEDMCFYWLEKI